MKKIGKIKLNEISNAYLSVLEMNRIFGGCGDCGCGDDDDDVTYGPFILDEVIITGKKPPCDCPTCDRINKLNNPHDMQGADKSNNATLTPFGEWLVKTLSSHSECCSWND